MRALSPVLTLSLLTSAAAAQCFDTAYGTPLAAANALFGDFVFPMQSIGFPFPLGGTTYAHVHVCDKGYVWLSNNNVPQEGGADITPTAAELASAGPRICALWSDIQVLSSNNGMVYLKSTPTHCTITWINARCYSATSGLFDMQMTLEPSGAVKVLFGPGTTNNSLSTQPTWFVGVAGVSPGNASLPAASDLSAGGATTAPVVYEEWLVANTFDMANNGLLYLPTSPGYVFIPLGAPSGCATASNYGTGCGSIDDSFHELSVATAFDLANTTIQMFRQAGGYLVVNAPAGVWHTPTASALTVALGDDVEQTVTLSAPMPVAGGSTTQLTVCSNGRIALDGIGNGSAYTPDSQTFLDFASTTIAANWHDYNPTITGSGAITFEQVGNIAYVTWSSVYSFGTSLPDSFQYQFDVTTGNVTIVYGSFSLAGNDCLVGYSVGGPSVGAPVDLSAVLPASLTVADVGSPLGLALTTNSSPSLGNAGFALVTSGVPSLVPLGVLFVGDAVVNPGLDLTFLGMPGCFGYTNANLTSATFPVAGGTGIVPLPIPNVAALAGLSLTCQSLAFSQQTPANLITSNGTQFTLGQ